MADMMKAVGIKGSKGSADALFIDELAVPKPGDGQALIKIKAFGLNRMDLLQREGKYPVPPQAPSTMGVEFSGVIKKLGVATGDSFEIGDSVFGLAYGGAYAEYIVVSTCMLIHKPQGLTWEEAAGIPETRFDHDYTSKTWITASQALYMVGEYAPGMSILWHAGASSVSIAGIQLAKIDNASAVYVTAGSQEKIDFCIGELGATAGYNYKEQDWASEIMKATNGRGVDIIVDFVGATHFQGNLDVAAQDARIVQLGQMSGSILSGNVDISGLLRKRLRFEGSTLRSRDEGYQKKLRDLLVDHALPKFNDQTFKIFIEKVFPFEEIAEAHRLLESNQTKGKIICTIN
ncbi:quinone oxidoreductase putative [Aspergillus heteromorphus CBS 117.55]|uniref:Quinone oxidoreductase putative n=1 Tax=Aspergillus heteromorphus CBS 117.55 TaxID=1448321 RepID=A0A317UYQ9_9EURO|nr:quinone oxidoreductase putative [Aspergillus heteromorphus CBS 117.55]PWY65657.1 quinone oxidoreductase putative [Aspergillus heteromorphus CBS 117.55]